MEQTQWSETSAYTIQTPGNYPEESIQHSENGESLKSRKANSIGHVLCRNCHLKQFIVGEVEGKVEVMGRWERRSKQLLNELKGTSVYGN